MIAFGLALVLQAGEPQGAATAYHAARIWHEPGAATPYLDDAYLVVRDGKVVAVTKLAAELPPLAPVIELGAAVLIPGLVAADATLTGHQPPPAGEGVRALEPGRRALDDFDLAFDHAATLARGVTTVYVSPYRNLLVGGRGGVVKLAGEGPRVLRAEADVRLSLLPEAHNPPAYFRPPIPPTSENPIGPPETQPATSRAGALYTLRAHAAELRAALEPGLGLRVAAHGAQELDAAAELAREWQARLVVTGAWEGGAAAPALARAGAVVVFEAPLFLGLPQLPADFALPDVGVLRRLRDAGVTVAVSPGPYARWNQLLEAAQAARGYGLDENEALAAVTSAAARALGVHDRVGSLTPGLDADFVVLEGAPATAAASVRQVYVGGVRVWDSAAAAAAAEAIAIRRGAVTSSAARTPPVVVRAGTIWTGDGVIAGGEVLLRDGKVEAVGAAVPRPPGARVLDAGAQAVVTPGLIDLRGSLGLDGANVDPQATLGLLAEGSRFRSAWQAVARAGVTSMVVVPRNLPNEGARTQVLKTAAQDGGEAYVAGREVVYFPFTGGDRALRAEELKRALERGKAYFEQWEKWRGEQRKWAEGQAGKEAGTREESETALRARLAQGEAKEEAPAPGEPTEERKAQGENGEEQKKEPDPLNGLWEAEVEDERFLPEPVTLHARLTHEGEKAKGVFSSPDFSDQGSVELDGTWDAASKTVKFQLPTQFGQVLMQGTVDAPDHMLVRVEVSSFGAWEFEATRIEVAAEGAAALATRKARSKSDEPPPPRTDWRLEGLRALFEKRAVAVVVAERADEIAGALELFGAHGLPVHVAGGGEAEQVADVLAQRGAGVVVGPAFVRREEARDVVPAAALRARGLKVGFQSNGDESARFLPAALALAASGGLGAEQALAGLTVDAAALLGLQDRIGRLAPGCDGDLVVWSGAPLDLGSRVLTVFVNGREVPQP